MGNNLDVKAVARCVDAFFDALIMSPEVAPPICKRKRVELRTDYVRAKPVIRGRLFLAASCANQPLQICRQSMIETSAAILLSDSVPNRSQPYAPADYIETVNTMLTAALRQAVPDAERPHDTQMNALNFCSPARVAEGSLT
jgi:hypothetical protein